jgi:mannose-1-phosphate guanylyltransferase
VVPPDRILVVTNERLTDAVAAQLPGLPRRAVIGEPCKRDTAPCIGLAAAFCRRRDPDALMVVMPADHVIETDEQFRAAVEYAAELVEERNDRVVTFGVRPTYPAETFGYIQRGQTLPRKAQPRQTLPMSAYQVRSFREKPSADIAREYLESGDFYWNCGIFVWKARTIESALAQFEPEMSGRLRTIGAAIDNDQLPEVLAREFTAIQGKSIDYAVMERYHDVAVIEAPFQWDDVGGWQSLARLRGIDQDGNTIVGKHLGLRTRGSIVRTDDEHLIVTLGLEDCIVVHTPDATLVANKHDEESIRQVVRLLEERGWREHL